ncbi:nuclease, partial [Rhodospirillum rubrum]|nr:nuclease [Rhodospirillum rubrum]
VVDTGTLRLGGRVVRLEGVKGLTGRPARDMAGYIGDRSVTCRPAGRERWRCDVEGWDLSEVALFNGGARATADAPADLVAAERKARQAGRGVWGR